MSTIDLGPELFNIALELRQLFVLRLEIGNLHLEHRQLFGLRLERLFGLGRRAERNADLTLKLLGLGDA